MSAAAPIRQVIIAGGGTAGWMAAAALARLQANGATRIALIESDDIGTIGVGEATIPPIKAFNAMLGLDENDFLAHTGGTFKLGIEFDGWYRPGESYLHPFGHFGRDINGIKFHQFWLKQQLQPGTPSLAELSLSTALAKQARFSRPVQDRSSVLSEFDYAYHFDAGRYARYLRSYAEQRGVIRHEGQITEVSQRASDGFIESLQLANGQQLTGDLFIDCTGFRGLLIEQTLHTGYDNWAHWLPCDRAVAVPTARTEPLLPYTRAIARQAGWQWRIPLQHRTGNGLVYCSAYLSDEQALATLLAGLDAPVLGEARVIPFTTGRRKLAWNKNCVALGLAGGFMEPLESTSIHLIQSGISRLLALFPDSGFSDIERGEYNRLVALQWEQVRDFLIAHYKLNQRGDTEFWRACAGMAIPESLQHKLDLFRGTGRLFRYEDELFSDASWTAVLLGQGQMPRGYDPLVDTVGDGEVRQMLHKMAALFKHTAAQLPSHSDFVQRECAWQQPRPARST